MNKIFITHMHGTLALSVWQSALADIYVADHTMGLITFLRNILGIAPDPPALPAQGVAGPSTISSSRKSALKVEIFGPAGLRAFVRTILTLTHTRSADSYCVHELLMPGEIASAPLVWNPQIRTDREFMVGARPHVSWEALAFSRGPGRSVGEWFQLRELTEEQRNLLREMPSDDEPDVENVVEPEVGTAADTVE